MLAAKTVIVAEGEVAFVMVADPPITVQLPVPMAGVFAAITKAETLQLV